MTYPDPILWVYVFKRITPLTMGPIAHRDKYFVYAISQVEALVKWNEQNPKLAKLGIVPSILGRIRT